MCKNGEKLNMSVQVIITCEWSDVNIRGETMTSGNRDEGWIEEILRSRHEGDSGKSLAISGKSILQSPLIQSHEFECGCQMPKFSEDIVGVR